MNRKIVLPSLFLISLSSVFWHVLTRRNNVFTDVLDEMKKDGYEGELHYVTTKDGYILALHRITKGPIKRSYHTHTDPVNGSLVTKAPPILMMHGLVSFAMDWLVYLGNESLPYLLFQKGYDVWLANARATTPSLNHTVLDPRNDKTKFFDVSMHEIGIYDIPAMVDHILNTTVENKLFYVGISQGEASFLIMNAVVPEYNAKIQLASLLAPSSHLKYSKNILVPFIGNILSFLKGYVHEISRDMGEPLCRFKVFDSLCQYMVSEIAGFANSEPIDRHTLNQVFKVYPAGAPAKNLFHYTQMFKSGKFQHFDYGVEENLRRYGTPEPPEYDLKKVTAPVAVYSGDRDCWSSPKDVAHMVSVLPNVVLHKEVPMYHAGFQIAQNAKEVVYDKIIETIEAYTD